MTDEVAESCKNLARMCAKAAERYEWAAKANNERERDAHIVRANNAMMPFGQECQKLLAARAAAITKGTHNG